MENEETGPNSPATRRFVAQMRAAAERNSAQARADYWRDKSMEEKGRVIYELMELASMILAGQPIRSVKPPPMNVKERIATAQARMKAEREKE